MQSYIRRAPDSTLGVLYPINKMPRSFLQSLGCAVPSRLEVEGTLVLQPLAITLHTADLLSVVVWDGIGYGTGRGVDTVTLNALVERAFFLNSHIELVTMIKHQVQNNRHTRRQRVGEKRGKGKKGSYSFNVFPDSCISGIEYCSSKERSNQPSCRHEPHRRKPCCKQRIDSKTRAKCSIISALHERSQTKECGSHRTEAACHYADLSPRPAQLKESVPCELT